MDQHSTKELPKILDSCAEVIQEEDKRLLERRIKLFGKGQSEERLEFTRFGLALSGGGIRSAVINLGFLKTLNKFGILEKADYMSSVSGGGYTASYIQATLKNEGCYEKLFNDEHIKYMRNRGEYMMPGSGWSKRWNMLKMLVGYIYSLLMSWISPAIVLLLGLVIYLFIGELFQFDGFNNLQRFLIPEELMLYGTAIFVGLFMTHFFFNISKRFSLTVSRRFNNLETGFAVILFVWITLILMTGMKRMTLDNSTFDFTPWHYAGIALGLILLGYIANPNAISFHRFYRAQLADAFLHFTGKHKNVLIKDLFQTDSKDKKDYLAPYPIINTCLNLQVMSGDDDQFKGAKAYDYFLLSPLYCGAKLTKYVSTQDSFADYEYMTLPAATTISAAAVNPGMGMYSNKLLSILMTVFNARLGFWISNPLKAKSNPIVWWPLYFFKELLSQIGTANKKLNISDGGHIENLGVYELLRRKCKLIISVDGGADPKFSFGDLELLTVRARNELGVNIEFREGESPEEVLRPKPSHGYSLKRFAIADLYQLWEEIVPRKKNGKPYTYTVKTEDGKERTKEVEVLVNYIGLKQALDKLNHDDYQSLKRVLKHLDLSKNVDDVLNTMNIKEQEQIKELLDDLDLNPEIALVFERTLNVLNAIKVKLQDKIQPQDRNAIFKQIISVIEEKVKTNLKVGTLVYVKSSITAPQGKPSLSKHDALKYGTYKYKIYHPEFPHESTADQFFDEIQWEAYYQLGQYIGSDVLGIDDFEAFQKKDHPKPKCEIEDLIDYFDDGKSLFTEAEAEEKQKWETTKEVDIIPTKPMKAKKTIVGAKPLEEIEASASAASNVQENGEEKVTVGKEVNFKM